MPKSIDTKAKRRKEAWRSVLLQTVLHAVTGAVILLLKWQYHIEGFWGVVMILGALLEFGILIPTWMVMKTRLKEIEGGEEDAAAQY